jgi:hypothetical protein
MCACAAPEYWTPRTEQMADIAVHNGSGKVFVDIGPGSPWEEEGGNHRRLRSEK